MSPKVLTVRLLIVIAPLLLLSACNHDEVITDKPVPPTPSGSPRPSTPDSKATINKVYEWTPAPGQFINEAADGGDNLKSPVEAAAWAQQRLENKRFVTLGGFGGYIIVGFDHSIIASAGEYDFAIAGNAFFNSSTGDGGSNEPGIVYVMQDSNGNGMPDDEWFEVKGSEFGKAETISGYEVTYFKPSAPAMSVEWTDNLGNKGTVDYLPAFHKQASYYPAWITEDSYTLTGVCLAPNNSKDLTTGMWNNNPFAFGYADNMGADNFSIAGYQQCNRFRIADAVKADGSPARLVFIDFIKVQTGVNAKSGWLGEVSTEVFGFFDLNLL